MQEMPRSDKEINSTNLVENKSNNSIFKKLLFSFVWLGVLLFLLDILTKVLAVNNLVPGERNSSIIPWLSWLFVFTLTFNKGAAFGIGDGDLAAQIVFVVISYVVAAAIIVYLCKKYKTTSNFLRATIMVILAGDLGNAVDRLFAILPINTIYSNGVIDFVDITGWWKNFGIFNFADACLTVGILMLAVYLIVSSIKEENNKKTTEVKK